MSFEDKCKISDILCLVHSIIEECRKEKISFFFLNCLFYLKTCIVTGKFTVLRNYFLAFRLKFKIWIVPSILIIFKNKLTNKKYRYKHCK